MAYRQREPAAQLRALAEEVGACRACPRLVEWREQIGREKRKAYEDHDYWARGVPGFGDPAAHLLVVGLAPAAHGANRTGRMFTGDRSGDWLYRALYRAGYANQPDSVSVDDGLEMDGAWITSPVKCAPPENKPTPAERDECLPFLQREIGLTSPKVIVALGAFGWSAVLKALADLRFPVPRPRPRFGHAAEAVIGPVTLLGCYHPSQQNTFTGRLTETMLDEVLTRARMLTGPTG